MADHLVVAFVSSGRLLKLSNMPKKTKIFREKDMNIFNLIVRFSYL